MIQASDILLDMRQRVEWFVVFCFMLLAFLVRLPLISRQGLWADEIFSLAIATGHSLEQPAWKSDPALGDFHEPIEAVPASFFRKYSMNDGLPSPLSRVWRAVMLSDTSPPLYYLLLNCWLGFAGTSDTALRLFSLVFAIASMPFLWLLGLQLMDRRIAILALIIFSFSTLSGYYSTEGRMYSFLWFEALAFVYCSLYLKQYGLRAGPAVCWIILGGSAILTHYYFLPIWVALVCWLVAMPGENTRIAWGSCILLTICVVAPWYQHLPWSWGQWRITSSWLVGPMPWVERLEAPVRLCWSLFSPRGYWGGPAWAGWLLRFGFVAAFVGYLWRLHWHGVLDRFWLGSWFLISCLTPTVTDSLFHTHAAAVTRYALPGFPAACLLLALCLAALHKRWMVFGMVIFLVGNIAGLYSAYNASTRQGQPFRELGEVLSIRIKSDDLLIVHSIPSGVIGISRYLKDDTPVASWVGQLGQRKVPEDIVRLISGRKKVTLLEIHTVDQVAPEEDWLRSHGTLVEEIQNGDAHLLFFQPRSGAYF